MEPSDEEISRVVELVGSLGGVDYAKKKALEFAEKAEEALVGLPAGAAVEPSGTPSPTSWIGIVECLQIVS